MNKKLLSLTLISSMMGVSALATNSTDATAYLNELRNGAGMISFTADETLGQAAQNHTGYLIEANMIGHYENNENNAHFTGESVSDRLDHVGYDWTSYGENVNYGTNTIKKSIDDLFVSIYHRFGFLAFSTNEVGAGMSELSQYNSRTFVYDMGTKSPATSADVEEQNPSVVKWPHNGYTQTQPAFFNTEFPAPLPECKTYGTSGNPISIQFNPSKNSQIMFNSFTLKDSDGQTVPIKRVTTEMNNYQFAFFPLKRLDWDSNYTASFEYVQAEEELNESWNFKTRSIEYPMLKLDDTEKVYEVGKDSIYTIHRKPNDCNDSGTGYSTNGWLEIVKYIDKDTLYVKFKNDIGDSSTITLANDKEFTFRVFTQEITELNFTDVTSNSVTLNWTHTLSGEESGYKIFRDGVLIHTTNVDEKSYTDTELSPQTDYKYRVKVTKEENI